MDPARFITTSNNRFELKDTSAFIPNDVDFTQARQGVEQ
jgi:hypothetical protein